MSVKHECPDCYNWIFCCVDKCSLSSNLLCPYCAPEIWYLCTLDCQGWAHQNYDCGRCTTEKELEEVPDNKS
jgi:hypothetical protein